MAFDYQAWLNRFPGTNFHELNIDWLIDQVKSLGAELKDFEAVNNIKYGGTWDISKGYAPWTIVTDTNGNGYISLKPVPAGIALDNTEYWQLVYEFISALADLTQRVGALEGTVSTMSGTVSNLSGRMTTAEGNITNIGNRTGALETKMKNQIKGSFSGHKFLFIGDSWGAGWNAPEGSVTSFETVIGQDLKPDAYYRADEGGAGFSYANGHWYGKLMQDWYNAHTSLANEITDLFIIGGQNDLSDIQYDYVYSNDQYECKWCDTFIRSHFPNAKVWVGMVARTSFFNRFATYSGITTTIKKYQEACRVYNWHYIPNSHLMVHDYSMMAANDGAHLTNAGYIKLGHYLADAIRNGFWEHPCQGYDTIQMMSAADTPGDLLTPGYPTTANITQFISPDGVTLQLEEMLFFSNFVTTIDCAKSYTLCKYGSSATAPNPNPANFFSSLYRVRIPVTMLITQNNATSTFVPAYITLNEDGTMRIRVTATTQNGLGWTTFPNITQLILCPFSHTIPLDLC